MGEGQGTTKEGAAARKKAMRKFTIKYEDYSGNCKVKTVYAFSSFSAQTQVSAKKIYWIKLQETPNP